MTIPFDGPYYDDIEPGHVFESPPAVTIEGGIAAAYQAIAGEELRLVFDRRLSKEVTGDSRRLASPGLVLQVAVGASTVATKRVIANLFYRNVKLARPVFEGETLHTTTRALAMADGSPKPGRPPRGKVLLGIVTTADGVPVLECERCPLIRLRGEVLPGHDADLGSAATELHLDDWADGAPTSWNLEPLGATTSWELGETRTDPMRDVVDNATALVRLTHNLASVHRDADASPYDQRLVYGGHTVALAQASLSRLVPGIAWVIGWHNCDHTAAVFEQDLLSFDHSLVADEPVGAGRLRAFRVVVRAHRNEGPVDVLDWTPVLYTT